MTEAEWLAYTHPGPMLEFLKGKASNRKLRLFAVGCCRRIWHLLVDEKSQMAVEVSERFADGIATSEQMSVAHAEAEAVCTRATEQCDAVVLSSGLLFTEENEGEIPYLFPAEWSQLFSTSSAGYVTCKDHLDSAMFSSESTADAISAAACATSVDSSTSRPRNSGEGVWRRIEAAERASQSDMLRDIFSNPFLPITLDPTWLNPKLKTLAQAIYDERAYGGMPVLADALEEAGCTNADILNHCRQPETHVRGCWVVDLILGKE